MVHLWSWRIDLLEDYLQSLAFQRLFELEVSSLPIEFEIVVDKEGDPTESVFSENE
jgi:hypothetical protein